MLEVIDLWKSYTLGDSRLDILKGVNLVVEKASFVAILGASGTGKSTLLHLLGGLDSPDQGEVRVHGEVLGHESEAALAARRNRRIGFVFQFHHLLPEFTAIENVAIPARIAGYSEKNSLAAAREWLEAVGLSERLHHLPAQLSGGERQRVAFARALVNNPDLLLMDEPTGNLDPRSGESLFSVVVDLQKKKGLTIIMVTHNLDLADQTDYQLVLRDGMLFPYTNTPNLRQDH